MPIRSSTPTSALRGATRLVRHPREAKTPCRSSRRAGSTRTSRSDRPSRESPRWMEPFHTQCGIPDRSSSRKTSRARAVTAFGPRPPSTWPGRSPGTACSRSHPMPLRHHSVSLVRPRLLPRATVALARRKGHAANVVSELRRRDEAARVVRSAGCCTDNRSGTRPDPHLRPILRGDAEGDGSNIRLLLCRVAQAQEGIGPSASLPPLQEISEKLVTPLKLAEEFRFGEPLRATVDPKTALRCVDEWCRGERRRPRRRPAPPRKHSCRARPADARPLLGARPTTGPAPGPPPAGARLCLAEPAQACPG